MLFKTTAMLPTVGVPANAGRNDNRKLVGGDANKMLRIMKLTTFFLLSACMGAAAAGHGQVTLNLENVPVQKVFKETSRQTGVSIIYNEEAFKNFAPVTIKVRNASINEVLGKCLQGQPFTFSMNNNVITITRDLSSAGGGGNDRRELTEVDMMPPPIDITGKVTDADGNPLAGASVKVKGTNNGTTTNSDGVFLLKGVDENAVLEISYVGFETYTIAVNNKTAIIASLKIRPESLNEVVINKGYYTEKQRTSTGNTFSIKAKDIERQPVNNPLLSLQGEVPGITITPANGLPGAGIKVRIQGQNSLLNGNGPLYVIDGVPYPADLPGILGIGPLGSSGERTIKGVGGSGSPLSYINPAEIESINILKDADATAIYGSRAANGAILITTKKGKAGKNKVEMDLQQGWGTITRKADMMNRRQYLDMRYEAFKNDGRIPSSNPLATAPYAYAPDLTIWDTTRNTDWQEVLIGGTAQYQNINVSISGGTAALQYRVGGSWRNEKTVFPGDFSDKRQSVNVSLNNSSDNNRFHFRMTSSYFTDDNQLPNSDFSNAAVLLPPIAPKLYNTDGSLNWAPNSTGTSTWTNPLSTSLNSTFQTISSSLLGNMNIGYNILPDLEISSNFGYTGIRAEDYTLNSLLANRPEFQQSSTRNAYYGNRKSNTWIIEPQLTYKKSIGNGTLNMLFGSTFQKTQSEGAYILGSGYINDLVLKDIHSAASLTPLYNSVNLYKYSAFFGRLNYDFQNKYIFNLTGRRDGSSRFGGNNMFHNFGSVGLSWIFSQEGFVRRYLSFLSFGKVRINYGNTGSDQIGDYTFLDLYNPLTGQIPYQGSTGLAVNGFFTPYLQWEETKKLSVGIDIGFLQDRILLSSNYARNRTSNQLINYPLPSITGNSSVVKNFPATVQNTSWEFVLSTINIKNKSFSWKSEFNLTIPQNRLIAFPNIESSSYATTLIVGKAVDITKQYHFMGVDPIKGLYVVADKNGNSTSSPVFNDRTVIISKFPKFYGGFKNNFQFKRIELDILFQFVRQIGLSNSFGIGSPPGILGFDGWGNQPVNVLNRWQKPGDVTTIQKFSNTSANVTATQSIANASDANYTSDASYARLKNISLSWALSPTRLQKLHIQNCRIYLLGQNILTITKYIGTDPEVQSYTSLPPLKVLTVGLQVTL